MSVSVVTAEQVMADLGLTEVQAQRYARDNALLRRDRDRERALRRMWCDHNPDGSRI